MLPSGRHARAPSLGLSTLDTSPVAALLVIGGGEYQEASGWFPPACANMGVLGGIDQGEALVRTFFGSSATMMDYARPVLRRN